MPTYLDDNGDDITSAAPARTVYLNDDGTDMPTAAAAALFPTKAGDEREFQQWYSDVARRYELNPDPDAPETYYDYRAAHRAGALPDATGHWPSDYKLPGHPSMVVGGFNVKTGERVPGTKQASEAELAQLGWDQETAARLTANPVLPAAMRPVSAHLQPIAPAVAHGPTPDPEPTSIFEPDGPTKTGQFIRQAAGAVVTTPASQLARFASDLGIMEPEAAERVAKSNAAVTKREVTSHILDDPKGTLGNPMWWAETMGQAAGSMASLISVGAMGGKKLAAAAEAAMEGASAYEEARSMGGTPAQAAAAAAMVVAANAPWILVTNSPLFEPVTKSKILNTLIGAASEGVQEAGQSVISDAAAQVTYDPQRGWINKGTLDSAVVGAAAGGPAGLILRGEAPEAAADVRAGVDATREGFTQHAGAMGLDGAPPVAEPVPPPTATGPSAGQQLGTAANAVREGFGNFTREMGLEPPAADAPPVVPPPAPTLAAPVPVEASTAPAGETPVPAEPVSSDAVPPTYLNEDGEVDESPVIEKPPTPATKRTPVLRWRSNPAEMTSKDLELEASTYREGTDPADRYAAVKQEIESRKKPKAKKPTAADKPPKIPRGYANHLDPKNLEAVKTDEGWRYRHKETGDLYRVEGEFLINDAKPKGDFGALNDKPKKPIVSPEQAKEDVEWFYGEAAKTGDFGEDVVEGGMPPEVPDAEWLRAQSDEHLNGLLDAFEAYAGTDLRPSHRNLVETAKREVLRRSGQASLDLDDKPAEKSVDEMTDEDLAASIMAEVESEQSKEANPDSRYAGENAAELIAATEKEQRARYREIEELKKSIAVATNGKSDRVPGHAKKVEKLRNQLNERKVVYDGAYDEIRDAVGYPEKARMRQRVEAEQKPATELDTKPVQNAPKTITPTAETRVRVDEKGRDGKGTWWVVSVNPDGNTVGIKQAGQKSPVRVVSVSDWRTMQATYNAPDIGAAEASNLRNRLKHLNNLLTSKPSGAKLSLIMDDIREIEAKLLAVDGLPDGYVLSKPNDAPKPIARPDAAAVTGKKPVTPQIDAPTGKYVLPNFATQQQTKTKGKTAPAQVKTQSEWREIGKNAEGNPVFEDQRGVRSYTSNGVRNTEAVRVVPGGGISVDTERRGSDFNVAPATVELEVKSLETGKTSTVKVAENPKDAKAVIESERAKNKAERADLIKQLKAKIHNQAGAGPDPEMVVLMVKILRTYIKDGILEFREAALNFQEDFGDGARTLDRHFEVAWQKLRGETGSVQEVLTKDAEGRSVETDERPAVSGDREALAGTPPADGEGARDQRPAGGSDRRSSGSDSRSGERPDSAGDTGTASAGDGTGAVRVPAKRGGDATSPARTPSSVTPTDYRIGADEQLASGGDVARINQNIEAIQTLKQIEAEGRAATPEEQAILIKFVGWGGLSKTFEAGHKLYSQQLKDVLTDEEYRAARASTPNAHYTSPVVIKAVYDGLQQMGVSGPVRMLEPAAGVGHFLGLMPDAMASQATRSAVEMDSISGRITQKLYPNTRVQVSAFQEAQLAANSFDVIVSNVPFGNYQVHDPAFKGRPKTLTSSIHNYYFAKALDLVRPGGVVAFITSRYTMDAQETTVRRYLADRADFLGAVRLPNTAFRQNAGTDVVTDIIFLQKREDGGTPKVQNFTQTNKVAVGTERVAINHYYIEHPNMVLGKETLIRGAHKENEYSVKPTGDLGEQLREAMRQLPERVYEPPTTKATEPTLKDQIPSSSAPAEAREGSWYQDDKGQLYIKEKGVGVPIELSKEEAAKVKALIGVRDAVRVTMRTMLTPAASDEAVKSAQRVLNRTYDSFVKRFGYIAKRSNYRALREDPDVYTLLALEEWAPKATEPTKAAIFKTRTLRPHTPVEHVDTPKEAMLVSLNETGRINWPRMAELTGQSEHDLQLALEGLVFFDPSGNTWEQSDRYLSGNVKAKLKAARAAAEKDSKYALNVQALEAVQPADLEPQDISLRLGAPWIPAKYIDTFASHLGLQGLRFRYSPALAKWTVDETRFRSRWSVQNTQQWGTERKNAHTLLAAALNLGDPVVTDTVTVDGKETSVVNQKETIAARDRLQAMQDEFKSWAWDEAARAKDLAGIYNETMNTMRLWEPDGAHLSLPGTSPSITFRPHQKNFIWRGLQQANALAHHVVGAGKTYAGIALAIEKRRLGLARKPMVVVPNHLPGQWARDVLKLYPAAKVLAGTKEDFEPKNRRRFLNRIATGDWDVVIVPYSHFGMMAVKDDTFNAYLNKEIDNLEIELKRAREEVGKGDPSIKELEKSKLNLQAKLRNAKDKQKKDDTLLPFEDLGVDMLIVDEAHNFKSLKLITKMTRVAGVPSSGSDRAFDLFIKSRYLNTSNPTGGTVFLTGTPISNTMAEMFVLMRYLSQGALDERGIPQFDGWAATFGEKVTAFEISPTGRGFRQKTRFAKFTNLPELVQMYRAIADVQTADMLKLPTPPLKGGKAQLHMVAATPELDAVVEELLERFEAVLGKHPSRPKPDPTEDNPLKIVGDGRKAALDLRILGEHQPDGGKVDQSAAEIIKIYKRTKKTKGTQLVFADLGTPSAKAKKGAAAEFTVYAALRDKLVAAGIPAAEIKFIHEAKTSIQKNALYDAVNAGDVRVLIGSTEKMGAGMNVQQRLVALHHLDAPWRPSDIEQREGRILRQGNLHTDKDSDIYDPNFEVEIHTYLSERSFDAYLWQLLENKARFINQALKGDITSRETDDADEVVLNFAQAKAASSGNPAVMEHAKTQGDVQRLEISESNHGRRKWRLQQQLATLPEQIEGWATREKEAQAIVDAVELPKERKDFTLTVDGKALQGEDAAKAIAEAFDQSNRSDVRTDAYHSRYNTVVIGEAAGVEIRGYRSVSFVQDPPTFTSHWQIAAGDATLSKPATIGAGAMQSLWHLLENLPKQSLQRATEELTTLRSSLEAAKKEIDKPFAHAENLKKLRDRMKALELELNLDAKAQAAEAAAAGTITTTKEDERADAAAEGDEDDTDSMPDDLPRTPLGFREPPERGGTATPSMRPEAIQASLQKALGGVPVRVGRFAEQSRAIYRKDTRSIRVRTAKDLRAVFHEAGHDFDQAVLGLNRNDARWADELLALGQETSRPGYSRPKVRKEGAAEFFVLYMSDPEAAHEAAPAYFQAVEEALADEPALKKTMHAVRRDLRGFLGLTDAEQGKLMIDRGESDVSAARAAIEDPKGTAKSWFQTAIRTMVDDLQPLKAAVEQMRDGRPLAIVHDAYKLARLARGAAGKASAFLQVGVRGADGKFIGPSLADAISPVREHLKDFGDYLVALRAIELLDRNINPGMTRKQAQAIIDEAQQRDDIAVFDQAKDAVYKHQDALLAYAEEFGAFSAEQIKAIRTLNQAYVPMQRVMDAADGALGVSKSFANRASPIKRIKGSGRSVVDPLESMVKNAFAIVDMVEKNRAMIALVEQAEDSAGSGRWLDRIPDPKVATQFHLAQLTKDISGALSDAGLNDFIPDNLDDALDRMVTVFTPAHFATGKDEIVTVIRNGKREFWQVNNKGLYDAIAAIGPRDTSVLRQWLEKPTKLLRAGATLTPGFILRNPGRDTLVAWIQSRHGFIPVVDTLRGFIGQVRGDADAKLFFASGVGQATLAAQDRKTRQQAVEQLKRHSDNPVQYLRSVAFHPIDLMRAVSSQLEVATRLGEFKLALDAGGEERGVWGRLTAKGRPDLTEEGITTATLAAFDVTTDFSRAGSLGREINRYQAFFNARVQGWARMAETAKRDPAGLTMKLGTMALFAAALWSLNDDDDEYYELEEWEKETYFHFKLPGNTTFVRIPKPFEWGHIANLTEAALTYAKQGDPVRFREMREQLIGSSPQQLVANLLPTAILPMVEAGFNYSAFRDTHIVRPWDLDLATDLQYTDWTSETAKMLGKVIPVAPAHLDHLIFGYTAGFGRGVVEYGTDAVVNVASGRAPYKTGGPSSPVQRLPVVGNFFRDGSPGASAQSIQDLYDVAAAIESIRTSAKADVASGRPESAAARVAAAPVPRQRWGAILAAKGQFKDIGAQIRAVYAAPPEAMSPAQKRERLDRLYERMVSIASGALGHKLAKTGTESGR